VTYKAQALAFRKKKFSKCIRDGIFFPPFLQNGEKKEKTKRPIKHRHFYSRQWGTRDSPRAYVTGFFEDLFTKVIIKKK